MSSKTAAAASSSNNNNNNDDAWSSLSARTTSSSAAAAPDAYHSTTGKSDYPNDFTQQRKKQHGKPSDSSSAESQQFSNDKLLTDAARSKAVEANENSVLSGEYVHAPGTDVHFSIKVANRFGMNRKLLFSSVLAILAGFLFGYDTGVVSGAIYSMSKQLRFSYLFRETLIGSAVGTAAIMALVAGWLNNLIGRRLTLMIGSACFSIGWIIMAASTSKNALLAGRFVIGIGLGMSSATATLYTAEIAPSHLRGRLVSCYVTLVAAGQLTCNILNGLFKMEETYGWRIEIIFGAVFAIAQCIGLYFCPESPRWLIGKGQEEKAREALQALRESGDVEEELEAIKETHQEIENERMQRSYKPILMTMIQDPPMRRALILGCSLQMFKQLAGRNMVMNYGGTIILMSGVKSESAITWLSILTSTINFSFTFVALCLVERLGRRFLALFSMGGAFLTLACLAVVFQIQASQAPKTTFNEDPTSPCSKYASCASCMEDKNCGFCFKEVYYGSALNGSCVSTEIDWPFKSNKGRCSDIDQTDFVWAYEYCPTYWAWMSLLALFLYIAFFVSGMASMPWTINSEIYPLWARSTGNSASTFTNWLFNLIVSSSFLSVTATLGRHGAFWVYSLFALAGFLFMFACLPETRGRSLEQVEGLFAREFFSRNMLSWTYWTQYFRRGGGTFDVTEDLGAVNQYERLGGGDEDDPTQKPSARSSNTTTTANYDDNQNYTTYQQY